MGLVTQYIERNTLLVTLIYNSCGGGSTLGTSTSLIWGFEAASDLVFESTEEGKVDLIARIVAEILSS